MKFTHIFLLPLLIVCVHSQANSGETKQNTNKGSTSNNSDQRKNRIENRQQFKAERGSLLRASNGSGSTSTKKRSLVFKYE